MYMYNDLYIHIIHVYVLVQFILSLSVYTQNTGSSIYYNEEEEDDDDPELLVTDNTSPEDLELSLGSK